MFTIALRVKVVKTLHQISWSNQGWYRSFMFRMMRQNDATHEKILIYSFHHARFSCPPSVLLAERIPLIKSRNFVVLQKSIVTFTVNCGMVISS